MKGFPNLPEVVNDPYLSNYYGHKDRLDRYAKLLGIAIEQREYPSKWHTMFGSGFYDVQTGRDIDGTDCPLGGPGNPYKGMLDVAETLCRRLLDTCPQSLRDYRGAYILWHETQESLSDILRGPTPEKVTQVLGSYKYARQCMVEESQRVGVEYYGYTPEQKSILRAMCRNGDVPNVPFQTEQESSLRKLVGEKAKVLREMAEGLESLSKLMRPPSQSWLSGEIERGR